MAWQLLLYTVLWVLTTALFPVLAFFVWRRRPVPGVRSFALLMSCLAWWAMAEGLGAVSADLGTALFWLKAQQLALVIAPVAWLAFVLRYARDGRRLTRRESALLAIEPVITLLLVWSNEAHGLIWSRTWLTPSATFRRPSVTFGIWFHVNLAYSCILIGLGAALLAQAWRRTGYPYRRQAAYLFVAVLPPCVVTLAPFVSPDLSSEAMLFALLLCGGTIAWGLVRLGPFQLRPLARHAVVAQMQDGVVVLDAEKRVVDLNPAAQKLLGSRATTMIGRPAAEAFSAFPELIRHRQSEAEWQDELVLQRGNTEQHFDIRCSPLLSDFGQTVGCLLVIHDITALKRADEALSESEEKYRNVVERANDGIVVIQDGLIQYANPRLADITGYGVAEMVGTPYTTYIWPENLDQITERYRRRMAGEDVPPIYETTIRHKNGTPVAVEFNAGLVMYEGQSADLVLVRDITERKRLKAEIEQRRQYLERVLASAPDAIVTLDNQQRVVEWNPGAQKLFGYSVEEARGQNIDDLVAGSSAKTYEEATALTRQVLAGQPVPPTEAIRYRKDGTPVDVMVAGSPILIGGEFTGVVAVYTDISERKQAEEQLQASLREKEMLVKEVHHRVKNNLQVISSLLYLQSLKAEERGASGILQDSRNQVRSMALVHEKLYGSQDLSRIDFGEYVSSLTTSLLQSHGAASGAIDVQVDVDDVQLSVDLAIPCGLILNELVSNSLKHAFTGRDTGEIVVGFYAHGDTFVLSVSDNGVGVADEVDVHETESLGLQLVNMLVEQLGGTIDVEGYTGTRFTITFPARRR